MTKCALRHVAAFLPLVAVWMLGSSARGATLWYSGDSSTGGALYINRVVTAGIPSEPNATIFQKFLVADASGWEVSQLWSNNIWMDSVNPQGFAGAVSEADWSIRSGVSPGNGGFVVAGGTSPVQTVATGRTLQWCDDVDPGNPCQEYAEYGVIVSGLDIPLAQGEYWTNVTPHVPFEGAALSSDGANALGEYPASDGNALWWWSTGVHDYDEIGLGFSMGVGGTPVVPEPATGLLLGVSLAAMAAGLRCRRPAVPRSGLRCRPGRAAAAVVLTLCAAAAAGAKTYDVSYLVSDSALAFSFFPRPGPSVPCGERCRYVASSSALVSETHEVPDDGTVVSAWPAESISHPVLPPSVARSLDVPADYVDEDGNLHLFESGGGGVARRAAVDYAAFSGAERRVAVQTYATGSGTSVTSYGIRLNTGPDIRWWFVEFSLPVLARVVAPAYLVGGPSGAEPIEHAPNSYEARSAVDVYIDGLPAWSGESSVHLPEEFDAASVSEAVPLSWGERLPAKGDAFEPIVLSLGKLEPGRTIRIELLVSTEERVDAPACVMDSDYAQHEVVHRCHSQVESLVLPAGLSLSPRGGLQFYFPFRAYSR